MGTTEKWTDILMVLMTLSWPDDFSSILATWPEHSTGLQNSYYLQNIDTTKVFSVQSINMPLILNFWLLMFFIQSPIPKKTDSQEVYKLLCIFIPRECQVLVKANRVKCNKLILINDRSWKMGSHVFIIMLFDSIVYVRSRIDSYNDH